MAAIGELFAPEPQKWGLRGDPHLWRELAQRLSTTPIPGAQADLLALLREEFSRSTGAAIDSDSGVMVERFQSGGMSSGMVSPAFWRQQAFPLLIERYASLCTQASTLRRCLREPLPVLFDVARYLDAATSAHLSGHSAVAGRLFELADSADARDWLESVWGKQSKFVVVRTTKSSSGPPPQTRMPTKTQVAELHRRDGFHCRYCGLPVIRAEVRKIAAKLYPQAVPWGRTNASQHAGFQVLWAQYDHVDPHAKGGANELDNLVVACAACNFGKWHYRLDEVGLLDPRTFPPVRSGWDGLERLLQ